jgi:hypothetical protein
MKIKKTTFYFSLRIIFPINNYKLSEIENWPGDLALSSVIQATWEARAVGWFEVP